MTARQRVSFKPGVMVVAEFPWPGVDHHGFVVVPLTSIRAKAKLKSGFDRIPNYHTWSKEELVGGMEAAERVMDRIMDHPMGMILLRKALALEGV